MTIKRVVFIRPGETPWNRLKRWQGQVAVPLNEHGRQQAQRLANFIRMVGINTLYSSDLRRAIDTAEILASALGMAVQYDARLRERHIGEWQGLTLDEIIEWYSQAYAELQADPDGYVIPGGESRLQVMTRVRAMLDYILKQTGDETVGIVTHTTAIRTVIADLVSGFNPYIHEFANISVTTLVHEESGWKVTQVNDVSHLEGMESLSVAEVETRS